MEDPARTGPTRPSPLWPCSALLAGLNLILYAPVLDNGLSLDDFNWLARAEFASSWWSFVFGVEPGQILNPVPRGMFLLLHRLSGGEPFPFHAAILGLHVVTVILLLVLVDRVAGNRQVALLAAILFSLESSYDEAIFWVAAFFYPLSGVLCLGALIAAGSFLTLGGTRRALVTVALAAAGVLTKASCFAVLPVMLLLPGPRPRRARLAGLLASLVVAAVAVNVAVGAGSSYLISEGHYRLGSHVASNVLSYLGWMIVPFDQALGWLGLSVPWPAAWQVLGAAALAALVVIVLRAGAWARAFVGLLVSPLALALPFVFEPVSRYTYLPALGASALAAGLLVAVVGGASRFRWLRTSLLAGAALLSLADTRLRDNHYEYRERLMATWVDDVVAAVPAPPLGGTIRIIDLPRLAIDPGIHLAAALQLAYDDPRLHLEILSGDDLPSGEGPTLRYLAGRITLEESAGTDGGQPSPGEVPRDHVPEVEQIDPEQRERSGERGQEPPAADKLPEAEGEQRRAGRGQHQQVSALGLEVVPAVRDQRDQQGGVRDDRPEDGSVGAAPARPGPAETHEPETEPDRGRSRQGDVDDEGPRIGQHLHPAEGAPPALEAAPQEDRDPVLAEQREVWARVVEPQRTGGHRERVRPAVEHGVPDDPGSRDRQGDCTGRDGGPQPAGARSDDPEPHAVQRDREQGADLGQDADADRDADPQRAKARCQSEQQSGPDQLDRRIVADRHGHGATHRVERDEKRRGGCDPAIVAEHGPHEERSDRDHRTRQQQVEETDGGEGPGQVDQQRRDEVVQRRLVCLVADGDDPGVAWTDAVEVVALQLLEWFGRPGIRRHHRKAATICQFEDVIQVRGLVRPVERGYRGQVPDGERRVDEDRDRQPHAARDARCGCDEIVHEA
jgi:hypothetical protein